DEFWVHPDSEQVYVSDPNRPVKAWHFMLMGSYAKAAIFFKKRKYKIYADAISDFFIHSLLTPKGHPYGVNRMFAIDGSLVTWEELDQLDRDFQIYGIPWFHADRFGLVAAPHIARAGWAELDGLVENVVEMWNLTESGEDRKILEQLAGELTEPFFGFAQSKRAKKNPSAQISTAVLTPPKKGEDFVELERFGKAAHFEDTMMYTHDAEGAVYSYALLAKTFGMESKYFEHAKTFADFWVDVINNQSGTSGWPPHWAYSFPIFLKDGSKRMKFFLTPWRKESEEASRSLALGADFFRIDHVPHGLLLMYELTQNKEYLDKALYILDWIESLPEFNSEDVVIQRYAGPYREHVNPHNIHSDSPLMRASLLLSYAMAFQAVSSRNESKYQNRIKHLQSMTAKSMQAFVSYRPEDLSGKAQPQYSWDDSAAFYQEGRKKIPVYPSPSAWKRKELMAAPLYNEFYGGIRYALEAVEYTQMAMSELSRE
ncbi:MAG: hypothetical protein KDD52_09315, partial [Bdellovibrionales bacterium]|nr:hypothetical protein [Bdellovibrionales bacterium]